VTSVKRTVYRAPKVRDEDIGSLKRIGAFVPVFDSTDHFHFACQYCREIADILLVERDDSYAQTPTLYFHTECPKCKARGFRKIYLTDTGKHYMRLPIRTEMLATTPEEAQGGIIKRSEKVKK